MDSMVSQADITDMLKEWSGGNETARDRLMPLVESELRRIANRYMRKERSDHTLQATALINEAYIKLVDLKDVRWQNRAHFFGIAAKIMRRILVDYARNYMAEKRGGNWSKVSLAEVEKETVQQQWDLVALDEALSVLASTDRLKSQIIELRFFGGLTIEETAEVLGISTDMVKSQWEVARARLYRVIHKGKK
jgi:RNA polymerase sigma factor (TIGR02999 family)